MTESRDGAPLERLLTSMARCGLMPDCGHSMGALLYSMERQVRSLQERVKFQIEMINRRDEEIERVRLEMFKRAQLPERFEGILVSLKYDGQDADSLTVGEIRRAIALTNGERG